jgi:RNA polymerase sigma-70 factor (ECF subfamily)
MPLNPLTEKSLLKGLKTGDEKCFTAVFTILYPDLVFFAGRLTGSLHIAEEFVQDAFMNLWEERKALNIHTSLKSYLLRTVQNRCIDWMRHQKTVHRYEAMIKNSELEFVSETEDYLLWSELDNQIRDAVMKLPPKEAEAFKMSRYDGMKYHEIAEKLNVSVRTVEERMGKALHFLRECLRDYFPSDFQH